MPVQYTEMLWILLFLGRFMFNTTNYTLNMVLFLTQDCTVQSHITSKTSLGMSGFIWSTPWCQFLFKHIERVNRTLSSTQIKHILSERRDRSHAAALELGSAVMSLRSEAARSSSQVLKPWDNRKSLVLSRCLLFSPFVLWHKDMFKIRSFFVFILTFFTFLFFFCYCVPDCWDKHPDRHLLSRLTPTVWDQSHTFLNDCFVFFSCWYLIRSYVGGGLQFWGM